MANHKLPHVPDVGEIVEAVEPNSGKLERARVVALTSGTEVKAWVLFERLGFVTALLPISPLYLMKLGERLKYLPPCLECSNSIINLRRRGYNQGLHKYCATVIWWHPYTDITVCGAELTPQVVELWRHYERG